jgi:two-component system sensor histidine kinase RegB
MSSVESLFADRVRINISWLLTLRWVAVLGQLITVVVVRYALGIELPISLLLLIIGFTAVTNTGFLIARGRRPGGWNLGTTRRGLLLGSIMTVDMLMLTLMLYLSGGPFNPFVVFYLVNVALAAALLPSRWSWFLFALALGCNAILFAVYWPWFRGFPSDSPPAFGWPGAGVVEISRPMYLTGSFVATAIAATTIVYFVNRLTAELATLDEELNLARRRKAQSEKLEGLATLAAGAAHELASPLSTIAVVAKELERQLRSSDASTDILDDFQLIRKELGRCREILDHMAANAGETMGEPLVRISPGRLVAEAVEILRSPGSQRVRIRVELDGPRSTIGPARTLAQILRGLLQNAIDASAESDDVEVVVDEDRDAIRIRVQDHGRGIPVEVLTRLGEPFFTTKEPGRGMGLGLFLARTVLQRLGGSLDLASTPGKGTVATVRLPLAPR